MLGPALEVGGLTAERAVPRAGPTGAAGAGVVARFGVGGASVLTLPLTPTVVPGAVVGACFIVEGAGVLTVPVRPIVAPGLHAGSQYSQASIFTSGMQMQAFS